MKGNKSKTGIPQTHPNSLANLVPGKKGMIPWNKGKKIGPLSEEHKNKIKLASIKNGSRPPIMFGSNHPNWRGGITPINAQIRNSLEYKLWRKSVFERDNYQCVWGGKEHGNNLIADHIKPFAHYPELRFAIDNGRTLCRKCHLTTDTFAGRSRIKSNNK